MENKQVGYLLLGITVLLIFIIYLFNAALHEIVNASCSEAGHGDSCPMYNTINRQTYLSIGITSLVGLLGLFMIFTKPAKEVIVKTKTVTKPKKVFDISELTKEELRVFELVKEQKAVFQADLIEKTGFGKAKMTRIIDRLEGKRIVERKRRGMTNIVVLLEED